MLLADGTTLMHGKTPYDPKKAHEYYLRTRVLKGRKQGHVDPKVADLAKRLAGKTDNEILKEAANSKDPAEKKLISTMLKNRQQIRAKGGSKQVDTSVVKPVKTHKKLPPKVLAQQRKNAAARVASLRSELADLNKKLKAALSKQRKTKAKEKRGPTAAEKSKTARDSKKYRAKNQQKIANKRQASSGKKSTSGRTRSSSVDSLKKQIFETQGKLDSAIQRQKSLG